MENCYLSIAGSVALIEVVTSRIPNYTMMTTALPINICDKIDKMNRNFLWGDIEGWKRVHLVNWDLVCKSNDQGGLGIRKVRENNVANLAKLGWNVVKNCNSL